MAFGKKGKNQDEAAAAPPAVVEDAGAPEEELSGALFGAEEQAGEEPAPALEPAAEAEASDAAAPLGGDLLNMFQTTQIETDDLSVVLELAGDVDLTDLMEELNTVAAALGVARGGDFEAA